MKGAMGYPLQLSIVLDKYNAAHGSVFLEATFGSDYLLANIKMADNMIMF